MLGSHLSGLPLHLHHLRFTWGVSFLPGPGSRQRAEGVPELLGRLGRGSLSGLWFQVGICQKNGGASGVFKGDCRLLEPALQGARWGKSGSWGSDHAALELGSGPRCVWRGCQAGRCPLARQDAGAAAELDKELPFTQPVGLHHLTEGLVGWRERALEMVTLFTGGHRGPPMLRAELQSRAPPAHELFLLGVSPELFLGMLS